MTSVFDNYKTKDGGSDPSAGFEYVTVPHITLETIAKNTAIDDVTLKHQPKLEKLLTEANQVLSRVATPNLKSTLRIKLVTKEKAESRRSITAADHRKWLLPDEGWRDWEIPFDTDPDWPDELTQAVSAFREAWHAKLDEISETIAASAEQEELVDQPQVVPEVARISGPFTVEATIPPEGRLDSYLSSNEQIDEELETFDEDSFDPAYEVQNADAYVTEMTRLLQADGVRFLGNKQVSFERLDRLMDDILHAEGDWIVGDTDQRRVAVSFGPQYGPVTAKQVEEGLFRASRRGYDDLLFAGFSFDGAAQAVIQEDQNPRVRAHLTQIRPDVNPAMSGLLKETPNSQLFTVMGLPRTKLDRSSDGFFTITMEGVDIYDPVQNAVVSTGAEKVAAWFVDSDYDGRTFCICQAFFPDSKAWEKIARSLDKVLDARAFEAFSGITSLSFPIGFNRKAAVKVIDPRGNEVMQVHQLEDMVQEGSHIQRGDGR